MLRMPIWASGGRNLAHPPKTWPCYAFSHNPSCKMSLSSARCDSAALSLYRMSLLLTCRLCLIMPALEWNSVLINLNLWIEIWILHLCLYKMPFWRLHICENYLIAIVLYAAMTCMWRFSILPLQYSRMIVMRVLTLRCTQHKRLYIIFMLLMLPKSI